MRDTHTPLDGTFLAWANPPAGAMTGGDYPFAFDCPDAGTLKTLALPARAVAQIAAFAQQVTVYADADGVRCGAARAGHVVSVALVHPLWPALPRRRSDSILPNHTRSSPATSSKLTNGNNSVTGYPFWWALVDTLGGTFDVVIDPALLPSPPRAGNVLSGWFWLSGRISLDTARKRRWFSR